jgi:hypothetical protein
MRERIFAHSIAISKNVYSVAIARLRVFTQPRPKAVIAAAFNLRYNKRLAVTFDHSAWGRPNARPALVRQAPLFVCRRLGRFAVGGAVAVDVVVGVARHGPAIANDPTGAISP